MFYCVPMYELWTTLGKGKPAKAKTGPNDVSGVVWAPTSRWLLFFSFIFFLTN